MKPNGKTIEYILTNLPADRVESVHKLHEIIIKNLPKGFEAAISYGGLGYVVPHSLYPAGYHCKPSEPLPFAGIASQKSSIIFYHMGIYSNPELLEWFVAEYPKHCAKSSIFPCKIYDGLTTHPVGIKQKSCAIAGHSENNFSACPVCISVLPLATRICTARALDRQFCILSG